MAPHSLSILLLLCLAACIPAFTSRGMPAPRKIGGTSSLLAEELSSNDEAPSDGVKALLETPEFAQLLQSEKMQEAMQLVMAGKQEELQERVKNDKEFQEIVEKLNEILSMGPSE
mmetsp:Transcript_21061/g.37789  ORF Transcript_21061/g.37789 Transcript_21061/m.37789 type:complete len:115 (+) Transcript_21061:128-472(+)|eukprot:CAMPEP_0201645266 /NCGR_PEP_ID=MMETSP0493-20130528/31802_1 /ASSEMBLY_ACC=CAM_ASM_000838 /TAXON_ID=420259 /ORGANISM="Thalassiosira gravida, Strain GMp14c1" /LENGTH=114 /DNA_ID=CAMNT_0048120161 /DNA_START=109 /DNA_END=453 /DNA_ORIENTATION=+